MNPSKRILAIVAEKTGYPKDMLDLDLDLEADLGVDTVKQAELMAADSRDSTTFRAMRTSSCATSHAGACDRIRHATSGLIWLTRRPLRRRSNPGVHARGCSRCGHSRRVARECGCRG